MTQKSLKNRLILLTKVALTTGLLYYVISLINYEELKPLIQQLDILLLFLAVAVHASAFLIMSIRWWLILISSGNHVQYAKVFSGYYLGLFSNNFLPTAVGGDVVRIIRLRADGFDTNQLIFSTLFDRIIGLLAVIIMGMIGLNFSVSIHEHIGSTALATVNIVSGIFFLASLIALNNRVRDIAFQLFIPKLKRWNKINNFLTYSHENIETLKKSKIIAKSVLLSLVSQLAIVFTYYITAQSLGAEVALADFILVVPIVAIFTSLPISVGGMGVREGVMVFLLGAIGVPTTTAVSISLVYFAILILVTLPGGIFLLTAKRNVENGYAT